MNKYRFSGSDSSSDNGYWEVIIETSSSNRARTILKEYLTSFGRPDLIIEADVEKITDSIILHSTVQARYLQGPLE